MPSSPSSRSRSWIPLRSSRKRLGSSSWLIYAATALALTPAYIFAALLLHCLLHQPAAVSRAAGPYARWAVPRLFAHAVNIPLLMFFQAQSRIWAAAAISGTVLGSYSSTPYYAVVASTCFTPAANEITAVATLHYAGAMARAPGPLLPVPASFDYGWSLNPGRR